MAEIIRLTRAYNLFHWWQDAGVVCAIPEDCPVPDYLRPPEWIYSGRVYLPDSRLEESEDPLPEGERTSAERTVYRQRA